MISILFVCEDFAVLIAEKNIDGENLDFNATISDSISGKHGIVEMTNTQVGSLIGQSLIDKMYAIVNTIPGYTEMDKDDSLNYMSLSLTIYIFRYSRKDSHGNITNKCSIYFPKLSKDDGFDFVKYITDEILRKPGITSLTVESFETEDIELKEKVERRIIDHVLDPVGLIQEIKKELKRELRIRELSSTDSAEELDLKTINWCIEAIDRRLDDLIYDKYANEMQLNGLTGKVVHHESYLQQEQKQYCSTFRSY
jgi:hypothetical protein